MSKASFFKRLDGLGDEGSDQDAPRQETRYERRERHRRIIQRAQESVSWLTDQAPEKLDAFSKELATYSKLKKRDFEGEAGRVIKRSRVEQEVLRSEGSEGPAAPNTNSPQAGSFEHELSKGDALYQGDTPQSGARRSPRLQRIGKSLSAGSMSIDREQRKNSPASERDGSPNIRDEALSDSSATDHHVTLRLEATQHADTSSQATTVSYMSNDELIPISTIPTPGRDRPAPSCHPPVRQIESTSPSPLQRPLTKPALGKGVSLNPEPVRVEQASRMEPKHTQPGNSSSRPTKTKKKGKEEELVMKPVHRQFFRGYVFLFLPERAVYGKGEQLRRRRAQEWGAKLVTELTDNVTHILVDEEDWDYQRVVRNLDGRDVPEGVHLVGENWVTESMGQQSMVDPLRERHRIKGHKEVMDQRKAALDATIAKIAAETSTARGLEPLASSSPIATQDYEVPDSQPSSQQTAKEAQDLKDMPPPGTPSSLQLKSDRRDRVETPERSPGRSFYAMGNFNLVNKQPKQPYIFPETPPRQKRKHKEVEEPSWEERTPSTISYSQSPNAQGTNSHDALEEAMKEARATAELPLFSDDEGEKDESQDHRHFRKARKTVSQLSPRSWQNTFQCMNAGKDASAPPGPNDAVIAMLNQLVEAYENRNEEWRVRATKTAIAALRRQNTKVVTKEQALRIPGIGAKTAEKIQEIVESDRLRQLEHAQEDKEALVLKGFRQVYGAGFAQARKWFDQGFHTLDDLRSKANLTRNQRVGLAHYEDFLERIPRAEVQRHGSFVQSVAREISPELGITVGGSFRRGAETSGDVDFLVTSKNEHISDDTLHSLTFKKLIPALTARSYIQASLATSSSEAGSKWHGAAALPTATTAVWRRVDFLVVPPREWGAALIYFTGNDFFNRSIRLLASKKGMRLNQRGLYADAMRGARCERVTMGTLLEGRSEEKIFEILGVPYRPPEQRNIG